VIGSSLGPYLVVERLGAGGMGEVYLAFDTRLNRTVALKMLAGSAGRSPASYRQLLHEARAAGALTHPNIAGIHDVIEAGPCPCIVMEYVQGESLAARLGRGPMPCGQVLTIGIQLADALDHAHHAGVVHGDLKPGNVVLTPDGVAKILDFGVAKTRDLEVGDDPAVLLTLELATSQAGKISGTPAYMAPEQLLGRPASPRSDIYSLGVLLFELLTGRRPYDAHDIVGLAMAVASEPTPRADAIDPSVPADLSRALARAMAKEPCDRHQSAREFAAELRQVDRDFGEDVTTPDLRTPQVVGPAAAGRASWWRRHRLIATGVLALTVAAVALGIWYWTRQHPPPTSPTVIGILPLANLSGDESRDYVGVGISEFVLTSLASLPAINVVSGNDTGQSLVRNQDTRSIAKALGANIVLAGGVQEATGSLRFSAKLLKSDGTVLWAQRFEGPSEALFQLQSQVANEVVRALGLEPSAAERQRLSAPPSSNLDAYAEFARGKALMDRPDVRKKLDEAIAAFERAIRSDPRFGLAQAALAEALWAKYEYTDDTALTARALAAGEQALQLDPDSAAIRVSLALMQLGTGKVDEAVAALQQAIRQRPNDDEAHRLLARAFARQGKTDAAIAEFQRAIEIRPGYWRNSSALGAFYYRAGRYREAVIAFQRVTLLQPDSAWGYSNLGAAYAAAGDNPRALENFTRAIAIEPDEVALSNVGTIHYAERRYAEAAQAFERAVALGPKNPVGHRNLGDAYLKLGRREKAMAEYDEAASLSRALLAVNPRDAAQWADLGVYLAKLGRRVEALDAIGRVAASGSSDGTIPYKLAVVHALLGQSAEAVAWLERAVARGYSRALARGDDDLEALRKLPTVQALLRESR
jgi:eukaryotic-like serine/threonine-protein kinase